MIKPLKREKVKTIQFKITEGDWVRVLKLAGKHANGNVSEFIRRNILSQADEQKRMFLRFTSRR